MMASRESKPRHDALAKRFRNQLAHRVPLAIASISMSLTEGVAATAKHSREGVNTAGAGRAGRRFWAALTAGVLLCGAIYVGLHLSPSSYGIVLRELGAPDLGLVAGVPRTERGDEFAWQTPLLQMTVRSGFGRYDLTPPYFEDLRGLYGMPILDWAIVFKPQFWAFFTPPAIVTPSITSFSSRRSLSGSRRCSSAWAGVTWTPC